MPREDEQIETEDDRMRVGRRSFIALAGAALATGAGLVSQSTEVTVPAQVEPMELYGYGGTPIRTTESISSTSTTSTVANVTQLSSTTETEPNDDRETASKVGVDVEVTGTLDPAEVDWYAFDLVEGQQVDVTLSRETSRGVTALILYGPEGDYVDMIYAGNGKPVSADIDSAAMNGTHYAEVADIQSGDGPYVLTIETVLDDGTTTDGTTDNSTTDNSTTDNSTSDGTTDSTNNTTVIDDTTIEFGTQGYGELGYGGITA